METVRDTIPFGWITGISPYNPRNGDSSDVASLAATIAARGVLHRLIVHLGALSDEYKVLDGGRRWRALQLNPPETIEVDIVDGTEAELRELALIPNVERKALHPVAEYEHFAALEEAGMEIADIARDFGITARQVKQRLALGRLAPEIRAAWRAGKISADAAQAFAEGETHAAQKAVLDYLLEGGDDLDEYEIDAWEVKRRLQSDAVPPFNEYALYVGPEAYLAAGGRIKDSLFEEETQWLDGTLCARLAREKMMREAEAIAGEEGWGFVRLQEDVRGHELVEHKPDYLEAERARLDAIADRLEEMLSQAIDPAELDAESNRLEAEQAEIIAKATLRAIAAAERGNFGLIVALDANGTLVVTRGVKERRTEEAGQTTQDQPSSDVRRPSSGGDGAKGAGGTHSPSAPEASEAAPSKAARAVLDEAMSKGFASSIRTRPDLALIVAVAYLGPTFTGLHASSLASSGLRPYAGELKHELLRALDGKLHDEALTICARAPMADLTAAFAEIIALSIDTRNVGLTALAPFAAALGARGAALRAGFLSHFDYDAYFAGATKDAAISAVRACDGETAAGKAAKLKKKELAEYTANSAKDATWLPVPLCDWATPTTDDGAQTTDDRDPPSSDVRPPTSDTRSTAEAIADAIDADAATAAARRDHVAKFVAAHCVRSAEAKVKASVLLAEFHRHCDARLSLQHFSEAMAAAGHDKHRYTSGVHYLGLKLAEPLAQAAE